MLLNVASVDVVEFSTGCNHGHAPTSLVTQRCFVAQHSLSSQLYFRLTDRHFALLAHVSALRSWRVHRMRHTLLTCKSRLLLSAAVLQIQTRNEYFAYRTHALVSDQNGTDCFHGKIMQKYKWIKLCERVCVCSVFVECCSNWNW